MSPCILPVLPVIFRSGGGRGARKVRAPYAVVAGLTLSFSLVTLFGALLLRALPLPDDLIRRAGLVVLVLLGIAMMVPRFEELLRQPFAPGRGLRPLRRAGDRRVRRYGHGEGHCGR